LSSSSPSTAAVAIPEDPIETTMSMNQSIPMTLKSSAESKYVLQAVVQLDLARAHNAQRRPSVAKVGRLLGHSPQKWSSSISRLAGRAPGKG
jgi:hypothetical protein